MNKQEFVVGEFYMGIPHSLCSNRVHMKCVRKLKRKIEFEYISRNLLSSKPSITKVEMTYHESGCIDLNGVREYYEVAHTSDKWSNAYVTAKDHTTKPAYWDKYAN